MDDNTTTTDDDRRGDTTGGGSVDHTPGPLTYEMGSLSGDNWAVAYVDFGQDGETGESVTAWITTDSVHASELELGDPAADLRLWTTAPDLLAAARKVLAVQAKREANRHIDYDLDMKLATASLAVAVALSMPSGEPRGDAPGR